MILYIKNKQRNNMKYSRKCVWDAISVFIPQYKTVRENGIHMNLPSCLRDVATEILITYEDTPHNIVTTGAKNVIRTALLELCTGECFMTFGDQDDFLL